MNCDNCGAEWDEEDLDGVYLIASREWQICPLCTAPLVQPAKYIDKSHGAPYHGGEAAAIERSNPMDQTPASQMSDDALIDEAVALALDGTIDDERSREVNAEAEARGFAERVAEVAAMALDSWEN